MNSILLVSNLPKLILPYHPWFQLYDVKQDGTSYHQAETLSKKDLLCSERCRAYQSLSPHQRGVWERGRDYPGNSSKYISSLDEPTPTEASGSISSLINPLNESFNLPKVTHSIKGSNTTHNKRKTLSFFPYGIHHHFSLLLGDFLFLEEEKCLVAFRATYSYRQEFLFINYHKHKTLGSQKTGHRVLPEIH